ncbi:MAG: hypothetical protein ABIH21_05140 [Patescibacteria group bacterium]
MSVRNATKEDMAKKVAKAQVVPAPGNFVSPEKAKVFVTFEGDEDEKLLFEFFDDELSFAANEFVGKTGQQCLDLFHKKDVAYLQS